MSLCFFVSDLHGNLSRYDKLFSHILIEKPSAVFIGGDILPSGLFSFTNDNQIPEDFIHDFIAVKLKQLKLKMGIEYPEFFLIMGNDDAKIYESAIRELDSQKLIYYVHNKKASFEKYSVYGYANVPPTPFRLKDWERYDVSRYVDPGCVAPEEGSFTVQVDKKKLVYQSIQKDLNALTGNEDMSNSIFLFHSPPYNSNLDRAALDGKFFDQVPLDVHVGSIAIEQLIKDKMPMITMHGHIHESTTITGEWKEMIGKSLSMNAAHDGPELALIRFDPENLQEVSRELI